MAEGKSGAAGEALHVGWVGVGILGRALAENLLKETCGAPVASLRVWNRTTAKAQSLAEASASTSTATAVPVHVAETAGEVVAQSDLVFVCLADEAASEAVYHPEILDNVREGGCVVDMSTHSAEHMRGLARAFEDKGVHFCACPVSGSKNAAEAGAVIALLAGDEVCAEMARPFLREMAKQVVDLGTDPGQAALVKVCVNTALTGFCAVLGETLCLGEAAGVDIAALLDVLGNGAIACPLIKAKGPAMVARRYDPAFPLSHAQKDDRLALSLADEVGVSAPVTAAVNSQFLRVRGEHGDSDFCAVMEASRSTGSS